jgi:ADP-ribose pyrophosphatase YjhB (NUDIX family)
MKTIIKTRWVIIKEDKIFLVRDIHSWNFIFPWWKQEEDETIKQSLFRELKEELWIETEIWDFIWFREYKSYNWAITIQYLFKINYNESFENIDKSKCSHSYEWTEAWFYSLDYLKQNNLDFPPDLEEIIEAVKSDYIYEYFL